MSRARFVRPPLTAADAAIKRLWRRAQKFSRRKLFLTGGGGGVAGSPPSGKTSLGVNG